jgi:SAM-dependent methyltransferase
MFQSWKIKALVTALISGLPGNNKIYQFIQLKCGRLISDPFEHLKAAAEVFKNLNELQQSPIKLPQIFEIGTGHEPLFPISWYLCGSGPIVTVDLHRRINLEIFRMSLNKIAENPTKLFVIFEGIVDTSLLKERFDILVKYRNEPLLLMQKVNILYLAPYDATETGFSDDTFDIHFSNNVFEHIPPDTLNQILMEAKRVLKPNGIAIHKVDESDHFAHTDKSIESINFLQYSQKFWKLIGGNQYSYHNRLREPDFIKIFETNNFKVTSKITQIDEKAKIQRLNGFKVHKDYSKYAVDELCTTSTIIYAEPN